MYTGLVHERADPGFLEWTARAAPAQTQHTQQVVDSVLAEVRRVVVCNDLQGDSDVCACVDVLTTPGRWPGEFESFDALWSTVTCFFATTPAAASLSAEPPLGVLASDAVFSRRPPSSSLLPHPTPRKTS